MNKNILITPGYGYTGSNVISQIDFKGVATSATGRLSDENRTSFYTWIDSLGNPQLLIGGRKENGQLIAPYQDESGSNNWFTGPYISINPISGYINTNYIGINMGLIDSTGNSGSSGAILASNGTGRSVWTTAISLIGFTGPAGTAGQTGATGPVGFTGPAGAGGVTSVNGSSGSISVYRTIGIRIATNDSYITYGNKGFSKIPQNAILRKITAYANTTGSINISVNRTTYTGPQLGTILISNYDRYINNGPTGGWISDLNSDDLIYYYVNSNSSYITDISVFLDIE